MRSEPRTGRVTEQPIYTCAGWQTQIFLLSRGVGGESNERRTDLSNVSLLMARSAVGFDFEREDLRWTEVALSALESERQHSGRDAHRNAVGEVREPDARHLRRAPATASAEYHSGSLREAVLRYSISSVLCRMSSRSDGHWRSAMNQLLKDAALKTALTDPKGLETPPMLAESWTHLMRACEHTPSLIPPGSLSDRVGDLKRPRGPWFVWHGQLPGTVGVADPTAELIKVAKQTAEGASTGRAGSRADWRSPSSRCRGAAICDHCEPHFSVLQQAAQRHARDRLLAVSRRYTDLERRMAFFVYPQAAPALRELMEASKTMAKTLSEQELKGDSSVKNAVEALGVPPSTLLRATWSILTKLLAQPIVRSRRRRAASPTRKRTALMRS